MISVQQNPEGHFQFEGMETISWNSRTDQLFSVSALTARRAKFSLNKFCFFDFIGKYEKNFLLRAHIHYKN